MRGVGALTPQDAGRLLQALARTEEASALPSRRRVFTRLVEAAPQRELFRPIALALPAVDPETRAALIELLPRINDVGAHDELLAMLRSPEAPLRAAAARALVRVGTGATFQRVAQLTLEPAFGGRLEAIEVLITAGGARALPSIVAALRVGTTEERIAILRRLGEAEVAAQGRAEALAALRSAFGDKSREVVVAAVETLANLASEDELHLAVGQALPDAPLEVRAAVLRGLSRFPSSQTVEALKAAVTGGPTVLQLAALDAAQQMASAAGLPVVLDALAVPEIRVRNRAADVLSALGKRGVIDLSSTLLWLLRHADVEVRRIAVHVAGTLDDPEGKLWPELLPSLRDADWWVRERIVDVLARVGGARIVPAVEQLLGDDSALSRSYGVALVERLRLPELVPRARAMLRDPEVTVCARAIEAVAELRDRLAVPLLIELLRSEEDLTLPCLEALRSLGAREAAGSVAALLDDPDLDVRAAALACLDEFDDPKQTSHVRIALGDGDLRLRHQAEAALLRWSKYGSVDAAQGPSSALKGLLQTCVDTGADTLIVAGGARALAKRGAQTALFSDERFSPEAVQQMILPLLSPAQRQRLWQQEDLDITHVVEESGARFRATIFPQSNGLTAVFQRAHNALVALEALGLPAGVGDLIDARSGLVLVAGPAQSGKSSTLHALIERMNETRTCHIVTLEGSIHVVHQNRRSVITQRELGTHAPDLRSALRAALREDPDALVLDDVREDEAIRFALAASETGHLVIATLQTSSCQAAVERVIGAFPQAQREHACAMLATSLRAALCQRLLPRLDGQGMVAAAELLLNTSAVAHAIRRGKTLQISSMIATSVEAGMQPMRVDVERLQRAGLIGKLEVD